MFEVRPIRTDDDLSAALAEIERLWDSAAGSRGERKLEVLSVLVQDYERMRFTFSRADPVDVLEFAISDMGRSRADLERLLGSSRASDILSRKRPLNLAQIRKIAEVWKLPIEVLAAPYEIQTAKRPRKTVDAAE